MDLFAAADGIASGPVPREVWPGVIWDEACEDEFGKILLDWRTRFPKTALEERWAKQAEQSARWAVELDLLNRTIDREVQKAKALWEDADKRRLHTEWLRTYGATMTASIVGRVKNPGFRSPDLGRSL